MALSCCVFARAACECHSPVVHCGFLRLWYSLTCGLVYIPKTNLRSHHAPPVIFRKIVRLWICCCCPIVKLHSHVCIFSLFGAWDQHLSRWFLWVCTREGESAFSNAVSCHWWQMEWPVLLADSLQSLLLNCKYFLSLFSSKGIVALNVLCTVDLFRF